MPKKKKTTKAKFTQGQKLRLVNNWAMQQSENGLKAEVAEVRPGAAGKIVYVVEVEQPTLRLAVTEDDLESK